MRPATSRSLDPDDWNDVRRLAHAMLDDILAHVEAIRDKPAWQPPSATARRRFAEPLPTAGRTLENVLGDVRTSIMPFATGNLHPRFAGWVHGAGTPIGMIAEMIAAGLNMNCGGRDHIGLEVERQIVGWMAEAFGYPVSASGLFLTGSSMANFLAVVIAKVAALGNATRRDGLQATGVRLVAYASSEAHGCIAQAMELAGLGSSNLRRVPVDAARRMDVESLCANIAEDRAAGLMPFIVVGTAGTVNTGAFDPLAEIAIVAEREKLWFHVDGAIGALAIFSPSLRPALAGIEASHSIALDFHKSGHVPYDAGFLLVRDGDLHKQAFSNPAAYLQRHDRGLAAGETWPCDLGLDLSRGFRALKTWMTIETFGTDRIGEAILQTCELAHYLEAKVRASAVFELKAQVTHNIVCFGVRDVGDGAINREVVADIQEAGVAVPSWTTIGGETVIRCAIINHRTTAADIDLIFDALTALAEKRLAVRPQPA